MGPGSGHYFLRPQKAGDVSDGPPWPPHPGPPPPLEARGRSTAGVFDRRQITKSRPLRWKQRSCGIAIGFCWFVCCLGASWLAASWLASARSTLPDRRWWSSSDFFFSKWGKKNKTNGDRRNVPFSGTAIPEMASGRKH